MECRDAFGLVPHDCSLLPANAGHSLQQSQRHYRSPQIKSLGDA
jgi:hypothetical protein